jgi:WD40 repeat protein
VAKKGLLLCLQVSSAYSGHTSSVEDIQWSPTEETVFASCSVDRTIRVFDTRERSRSMLSVTAHDADVNVISWNKLVTYMLASGVHGSSLFRRPATMLWLHPRTHTCSCVCGLMAWAPSLQAHPAWLSGCPAVQGVMMAACASGTCVLSAKAAL